MQTLARLLWSRISERRQDHRGASDVGVARPRQEHRAQLRVLGAARPAEEAQEQLRLEAELLAAVGFEGRRDRRRGERRRVDRVGAAAEQRAGEGERRAVGRVEREVVPVELHRDRAEVEQGAAVDVRDRVGDGVHLGRARVDEQRHPHHDRAEIERPGRGGGDHCQGEGGAFVGPCEEDLAADLERRGTAAGGDRGAADQARGGTARSGGLGRAAVRRGGGERRLGAVA